MDLGTIYILLRALRWAPNSLPGPEICNVYCCLRSDRCFSRASRKTARKDQIRRRVHASQGFFARTLNVSPSAVQQWESGAKRPRGSAAKLLSVVEKHGLEVLA